MTAPGGGLPAEAVVRLRLAIGRLHRQMVRACGDQDLPAAQLSALARTEQHGPLRLGELAAREGVAVPSMVRTLAPLLADGLIAKTPDPLDKRSALLAPTPRGLETLDRIRRERSALLARRSARLTPDQCRRLEEALPLLELLLDEPDPPGPVDPGSPVDQDGRVELGGPAARGGRDPRRPPSDGGHPRTPGGGA
ncbi:MarR family winged helix-turn-helix transcriptional regulator [Kitasatospora sp. NPDC048194]|uniref:MarR family winged helix-turn-helix transcriptional regulator n=1 Tax=Kitasatospora sp. NPDC048194 TaxID=3364045 RepID=UPI003717491B